MIKEIKALIEKAADVQYLERILKLCTPQQLNMFYRMYPDGPNESQKKRAIEQVEATIIGLNKEVERLKDIEQKFHIDVHEIHTKDRIKSETIQNLTDALESANKTISQLSNPINVNSLEVQHRLDKLDALEQGGVDNWEWYDEALNNANYERF